MNNTVIFLRTNSRPIPRILRFMHVVESMGYDTTFVGVAREKNLPRTEVWHKTSIKRIGMYYPMLNGKKIFTYLIGVLAYNIIAFVEMLKNKPAIIHISDFEAFLFVPFYKLVRRTPIIYNIHDNLAQRYPLPNFIQTILNYIEGICVIFSDVTLVPEEFRKDALPSFCRKKVHVIKNTPIDQGYFEVHLDKNEKIKIIYAGWIDKIRAIDQIIRLADISDDLEITVAGEGDPKLIEILKNHKKINYIGYCDNKMILKYTTTCHFVFSCYDPGRIINRYAASNKVAEAFSIGRPLIINEEIKIAEKISQYHCGIVMKFGDIEAILNQLLEYKSKPDEYQKACVQARKLYDDEYAWEVAAEATRSIIKTFKKIKE